MIRPLWTAFSNKLKKIFTKERDHSDETDIESIASEILGTVVSELKAEKLDLSGNTASSDGRITSAILEKIVNDYIKSNEKIKAILNSHSMKTIIPQAREWYDVCFANDDCTLFVPVNIKISNFVYSDNIASKKGLYYACTGKIPQNKDFEGMHDATEDDALRTNKWTEFYEKLERDIDYRENGDYYLLVIDKNDSSDVYFTSLKTLQETTPNGNNLPFQCNWSKNRIRVKRTHHEARRFLLKSFNDSLALADSSIELGLKLTKKLSRKK